MKKEAEDEREIIKYLKTGRKGRMFLSAVLSFGGVCTFPWMIHMGQERTGYTNSIFSVFLFFFLFYLVNKILKKGFGIKQNGQGGWYWPGGFGSLFSVCMIFGTALDIRGSVPFGRGEMWFAIVIWAVLFALLTRFLWNLVGEFLSTAAEHEQNRKQKHRTLFLSMAAILLCYLPVFLAVYPGFFVYDAQDEYLQVVTRNFSTHHPLVHVLLLGGIIQAVYKLTGEYNSGIACYVILQMTIMSFIFAWCVEKLKERGMKKFWRILLTLYFGLCPVLVMFSLCSAKDGLFTGALLVTVILLKELFDRPDEFFRKKRAVFLLAASAVCTMLFRHNGFYAYLVFIPIAIICLKNYRKKAAFCFGAAAAVYLLITSVLTGIFHARGGEHQEMLTVPISQMARVYGDEKESLPADEKEVLYRYLPAEALLKYTPKVSDGVKISFNNEAYEADKGSFLKLWIKWGLEHPFTYINAWFMTSYGFWYPDTVIDVYRGNTVFTYTYEDSSYFGYEVEEPGMRESRIPWLNEIYRRLSLEITQQKIPVISMLFSPGFLFWTAAFLLGFLCDKKSWKRVLPYILPMLVWLTVILGPTYLVRYVVFLWVVVPLLLWELFEEMCGGTESEFDNWK